MSGRRVLYLAPSLCSLLALWAVPAFAQFTANIQGVVQDPTGAGIAKGQIEQLNVATGERKSTTSDYSGNYRFVSLAPGNYKVTVEATGFSKTETSVTLLTEQNVNLPITLRVGSASESVVVCAEAP